MDYYDIFLLVVVRILFALRAFDIFFVTSEGLFCYTSFCYLLNTVSLSPFVERAFIRLLVFILVSLVLAMGVSNGTFISEITSRPF